MTMLHYTAKVKESRLLELPEEAQDLHLEPGEEVRIQLDRTRTNIDREKLQVKLAAFQAWVTMPRPSVKPLLEDSRAVIYGEDEGRE